VLYVCYAFPWVTLTTTVREVAMLRELGLPVEVMAFRSPAGSLMHEDARELLGITHFVPRMLSSRFIVAVARSFARHPVKLLKLMALGFFGSKLLRTSVADRARGVLDVLRGAYAADRFPAVHHFHAEFANNSCTAAMTAAELNGRTFSFRSHSSFNPQLLERKIRRAAFVALVNKFDLHYFFGEAPPDTDFVLSRAGVGRAFVHRRSNARNARLRVLCVGTVCEKKGQRYLVEAVAKLKHRGLAVECLIVGSGPLEDAVREQIRATGVCDEITIEPYRPHDELVPLYDSYDVFVLPCVVAANGDRDGLPVVLIEAMARGCLCVSSPVSGVTELIQDGDNGLLVPERNADALAAALERLIREPELGERLRRRGYAVIAERFTLERSVAQLAERFNEQFAAA
jgi:glycosyltransferase involved in cell wall biosynthesis